jgi:CHAT domain-containing protein
MNLDNELVTLSACESSKGNNILGEGMLSLTRNFIASGAKSVVGTLWPANDKATSELMISFYTYLKIGDDKDIALAKAQADYISKYKGTEYEHPYYWSGVVLTGDVGGIGRGGWGRDLSFMEVLATVFGFVILGFVFYKAIVFIRNNKPF